MKAWASLKHRYKYTCFNFALRSYPFGSFPLLIEYFGTQGTVGTFLHVAVGAFDGLGFDIGDTGSLNVDDLVFCLYFDLVLECDDAATESLALDLASDRLVFDLDRLDSTFGVLES